MEVLSGYDRSNAETIPNSNTQKSTPHDKVTCTWNSFRWCENSCDFLNQTGTSSSQIISYPGKQIYVALPLELSILIQSWPKITQKK